MCTIFGLFKWKKHVANVATNDRNIQLQSADFELASLNNDM